MHENLFFLINYKRALYVVYITLHDQSMKTYKWYCEVLRGTTSGTTSHYEVLRVVLPGTARYYKLYYELLYEVLREV